MTNDDALAIAAARTVDLWRRCQGNYLETPDTLRERALETLATAVREQQAEREAIDKAVGPGPDGLPDMVLVERVVAMCVHRNELLKGLPWTAEIEADRDRLRERERKHEEDEAACCPEDVGFKEYIQALTRQLGAAWQERDQAVKWIGRFAEELINAGGKFGDRDVALANLRTVIAERDAAIRLAADYLGVDDPALRSLACVQAAVEHAERLRADVVQQAARIAELEGTLKAEQDRAVLFGKGLSDYVHLRNSIHDDGEEPPDTLAEAVARVHALYLRGEQQEKRIVELEARSQVEAKALEELTTQYELLVEDRNKAKARIAELEAERDEFREKWLSAERVRVAAVAGEAQAIAERDRLRAALAGKEP